MHTLILAIRDVKKALLQYRVWMHLGWVEVKQRYRRSIIGPWWISLSMLIFILMMGLVFSQLFHQPLNDYIPFFTAGYLFWTFISSSLIEAPEIFKNNASFISQIPLPFSLYVFKHLARHCICFLHNFVIYLLVILFFQINPGWNVFWMLLGFGLTLINVCWMCFLVAMISTRFRDMVSIIGSCVQIAFFITPISWMPRLLDSHSFILKYNPFVYLLDIVRSPLLGECPAVTSWIVCLCMALCGCIFSLLVFSMARPRIAYWVN